MGLHRIRNEVIKRINVIVLAEYMVYMLASGIVDVLDDDDDDDEYTGSLVTLLHYDLSEFSDKLQQEVKRILEMNR